MREIYMERRSEGKEESRKVWHEEDRRREVKRAMERE